MAKRVFYYLSGFTIGAFFIYFLLIRGRSFDFWMPGERVKTEITVRKPVVSDKAICQFECLRQNKDSINLLVRKSKVDFKRSKVHENPCKFYVLEIAEEKITMEFSVCDTVVTLNNLHKEGKDCGCK